MRCLLSPHSVENITFFNGNILLPVQNFVYNYGSGNAVVQFSECIEQLLRVGTFLIARLEHSIVAIDTEFKVCGQEFWPSNISYLLVSGNVLIVVDVSSACLFSLPRFEKLGKHAIPDGSCLLLANGHYLYFTSIDGVLELDTKLQSVELYNNIQSVLCCFPLTENSVCVVERNSIVVLTDGKRISQEELLGTAIASSFDGKYVHIAFEDGRIEMLNCSGAIIKETAKQNRLLEENNIGTHDIISYIKADQDFLLIAFTAFMYIIHNNQIVAFSKFSNVLSASLAEVSVISCPDQLFSELKQYTCTGERQSLTFKRDGIVLRTIELKRAAHLIKLLRIRGKVVLVVACESGLTIITLDSVEENIEISYPNGKEIREIGLFGVNLLVFSTETELVFTNLSTGRIAKTDRVESRCLLFHPRYLFLFDRDNYTSYYFINGADIYCSKKHLFMPFIDIALDETGLYLAVLLENKAAIVKTVNLATISETVVVGCSEIAFHGVDVAVFGEFGGRICQRDEEVAEAALGFETELLRSGKTREQMWDATTLIIWD